MATRHYCHPVVHGYQIQVQGGSDWPQMGQILDFFQNVSQNVLNLI